ncbi:hypothetical protein ACRJ4B_28620 [Streptomyces sp. GTA36]
MTSDWQGEPKHRLVAIGDSLTQGFQSGAIFNTGLSYPAIVAYEMGCFEQFKYPLYEGFGGLPLNIELLLRDLHARYGRDVDWWETPLALFRARTLMDRVEDHWERGPGLSVPPTTAIMHNLAVFGWDLRDALSKSANECRNRIDAPKDDLIKQVVQNAGERAALRALPTQPPEAGALTQLGSAARLGEETDGTGSEHGIETLIVFLGANNALQAVTELSVVWSEDGYDDLSRKGAFTVWRAQHFKAELSRVAAEVSGIKARHVIWCTVPHVTIAPIARGVRGKAAPGSRYFSYYTRPWISDKDFDPRQDPHITSGQARQIDEVIDEYNDAITAEVRSARQAGKDWYLLETCGLLDRLASRPVRRGPRGTSPLVAAVRVAAGAAGADAAAELALPRGQERAAYRRRPVLARRCPPHDGRVRHPRPGTDQCDGAGRRPVPTARRTYTPQEPGARRLRPPHPQRHLDQPAAGEPGLDPEGHRLGRRGHGSVPTCLLPFLIGHQLPDGDNDERYACARSVAPPRYGVHAVRGRRGLPGLGTPRPCRLCHRLVRRLAWPAAGALMPHEGGG